MQTVCIDTIFVDVDGVLLDFRGSALKVCGSSVHPDSSPVYSMGKLLGMPGREFWSIIDSYGPGFWRHLPKYPWYDDLMSHLQALCRQFFLVTAPSWSPHSVAGKTQWIHDEFGEGFDNFVFTRKKELLARCPNSVLIDDSLANVEAFRNAGGQAILFPQVWNGNERPDDPVKYVVQQLELLQAVGGLERSQ